MKYLVLVLLFSIIISYLFSDSIIPGGIVNGTWDLAGSPYLIGGDIFIVFDSLVIEPGVVVEFQGHFKIEIGSWSCGGQLIAAGTEQDSIVFTCSNPNVGWCGLRFLEEQSWSDSSVIKYCRIEYGNASGTGNESKGGAIYCNNYSKLEVSFCTIINNNTEHDDGGAIYLESSLPFLHHLSIQNNVNGGLFSSNQTGIIYYSEILNNTEYGISHFFEVNNCMISNCEYGLNTVNCIDNCTVKENSRGIYNEGCIDHVEIVSSKIVNNTSGIRIYFSEIDVTNSLIANNIGGVYLNFGDLERDANFTNCTFANNFNNGLYIQLEYPPEPQRLSTNICNSIFWNNGDMDIEAFIWGPIYNVVADYCCIEDNLASNITINSNCINYNPSFVDPSIGQGIGFNALEADWSLGVNSPCINFGTPDTTGLNIPELDLAGNPRVYQGDIPRIDMGAYEFQGNAALIPMIIVNPDELDFGHNSPGQQSEPQILTIQNTGQTTLEITEISAPTGFSLDLNGSGIYTQTLSNISIELNEEIFIGVVFQWPTHTVLNGNIIISSNANNQPIYNIPVTGYVDDNLHIYNNITENTIWDVDTVYVENNIQVFGNVTLQIYPGTVVIFNNCRISIYGSLVAIGELDNEITFTGDQFWKGITINSLDHALEIKHCIIKNVRNQAALVLNNNPTTFIEYCEFSNNRHTDYPSNVIINSTNTIFTNCIFANNISYGHEIANGQFYEPGKEAVIKCTDSELVILNSIFEDNLSEMGSEGYSKILGFHNSDVHIINSLFFDNIGDHIIEGYPSSSISLCNSTMGDNQGGICFNGDIEITNSILWNDDEVFIISSSGIAVVHYSNIRGGQNAFGQNINLFWMEGNIDSYPLFINPEYGNYHFYPNSPCINAGTPDTTGLNLPEYDLEGNPRIYDDIIDMGCYEWDGTLINKDELVISNNKLSNHPNPFNPTTEIRFQISDFSGIDSAKLTIYNSRGQKVKSFDFAQDDVQRLNSVIWNGSDDSGKPVSSGVYLYKLSVGKKSLQKKMLLLK